MRLSSRSSLLVIALVVVDLLVIGAALVLSRRTSETTTAPSAGSSSSIASGESSAPIQGPLALAASADGALARVTRGSCDSRDASRSRVWTSTGPEQPLVERDVPRLQETLGVVYRGRTVSLVGTTADCTVAGFVSDDAGRTWERQEDPPSGVWWLDADTSETVVHGPGRDVSVQCTPQAVTTVGDGAQALVSCGDTGLQVVRRSSDRPVSTLQVADVTAADGPVTQPLALVGGSGCPAELVRAGVEGQDAPAESTDGSGTQGFRSLSCLSRTGAGTGLAVSGRRVFAQVGYRLLVSDDRGRSFTPDRRDPVTREAGRAGQ